MDQCPVADGGEGTVAALVGATGGRIMQTTVTGPLADTRVEAQWGLLGDGTTAVIEMAAASGLALVPAALRNPKNTTTFGTGELLRAAVDAGARRIILGIGGSATVDGGLGCCQAAGMTILRRDGEPVSMTDPLCGRDLADIYAIKRGRGSPLDRVDIVVAADVSSPLYGPQGAARVFGPQKGASPGDVEWFDAQLRGLAQRSLVDDVAQAHGAGAAGGLGFAMLAFFSATIRPGIDIVIEATRLRERLADAALCITAEGSLDAQSLAGKATAGVARTAREAGVPCVAVAGRGDPHSRPALRRHFAAVMSLCNRPMTLEEALAEAGDRLEDTGRAIAALLSAGAGVNKATGLPPASSQR